MHARCVPTSENTWLFSRRGRSPDIRSVYGIPDIGRRTSPKAAQYPRSFGGFDYLNDSLQMNDRNARFRVFSCRRPFRFNRQGAEKRKVGITLAFGVIPTSSCYKKKLPSMIHSMAILSLHRMTSMKTILLRSFHLNESTRRPVI